VIANGAVRRDVGMDAVTGKMLEITSEESDED
jgi:hypothetical protein